MVHAKSQFTEHAGVVEVCELDTPRILIPQLSPAVARPCNGRSYT